MSSDPIEIDEISSVDGNGYGIIGTSGELCFALLVNNGAPTIDAPVGSRYYQLDNPTANWVKTTAGSGSDKWQDTNSGNSLIGKLWQCSTGESGSVRNEFTDNPADGKITSRTPIIVPYDSILEAFTFSNADDNSDTNIEVYRVPFGSGRGPNPAEKILQINLRDTRVAVRNNFASENITVNVGDKLAFYLRDAGVDPDHVQITLYWRITSLDVLDDEEQYSGNIRASSSGDDDDD